MVLDKQRLTTEVLNVFFNEKHYISFTRNLKLYHFVLRDGVYYHENFNKHHPERLILFRRSKKLKERLESPKTTSEVFTLPQLSDHHPFRSLADDFQFTSQLPRDDGNYCSEDDLYNAEMNVSNNGNIFDCINLFNDIDKDNSIDYYNNYNV